MHSTPLSQTEAVKAAPRENFFVYLIRWLWGLDTRALELVVGAAILCRGLMLFLIPDSMAATYYDSFRELMSADWWGFVCVAAGFFQIAGVLINGHWRRSPWLRFSGALISASFFAMMSALFFHAEPPVVLVASVYAPIAIANFWAALNISSKA